MAFIYMSNLDEIKDEFLESTETPREYEINLETGEFIIRDGCISIVEGSDAIKIWIHKCLMTVRGKYDAYDWSFGQDVAYLLEQNLSRDYVYSEAKRMTEEALLMNKHILSLQDMTVTIIDKTLSISFTAVTNFGDVNIVL